MLENDFLVQVLSIVYCYCGYREREREREKCMQQLFQYATYSHIMLLLLLLFIVEKNGKTNLDRFSDHHHFYIQCTMCNLYIKYAHIYTYVLVHHTNMVV